RIQMTSEEQLRRETSQDLGPVRGGDDNRRAQCRRGCHRAGEESSRRRAEIRAARRIPVHIARSLAETFVLGAVPPLRSGALSLQPAALYDGDGAGPQVFRRQDAMAGVSGAQG